MSSYSFAFGTYQLSGAALKAAIHQAYTQFGMRDFDTAQLYQNEALLAATLQEIRDAEALNGVAHTPIHITTKLSSRKYEPVRSLQMSLERLSALKSLDGDTIDVLLHWPMPLDVWQQIEHAVNVGELPLARIGVCNHSADDLRALEKAGCRRPYCNQIELHPFVPADALQETLAYCREHSIEVHAHTVLGKGEFFEHRGLLELVPASFTLVQTLIAYAIECGAQRLCLSSMHRKHVQEWFSARPTLGIDAVQQRFGALGRNEPVEFYGPKSNKRAKAALSFSSSSQHADYLKLESYLIAPVYTIVPLCTSVPITVEKDAPVAGETATKVVAMQQQESTGVCFASETMRGRIESEVQTIAEALMTDILRLSSPDGVRPVVAAVSDFATKLPSKYIAPNLLLLCAKRLFEDTASQSALCPRGVILQQYSIGGGGGGNEQQASLLLPIKHYSPDTLKRKYKGNVAKMDSSIASHLAMVLRVLRSSYLQAEQQRVLQKRANKKSHLFCPMKTKRTATTTTEEVPSAEVPSAEEAAADPVALFTVVDSLTRPISDAIRFPTPMPVTVSTESEFADFFRDIRSGTPTVLDAAVIVPSAVAAAAGPSCAMKKKKKEPTASLCALTPPTAEKGTFFSDGRVDVCKQVVGSTHIAALCDAVKDNAQGTKEKGTFFADGRVDVCKQVVGSTHIAALCDAVKDNAQGTTHKEKGTFFSDGRVDVCKQVVGSTHIAALCDAVQSNNKDDNDNDKNKSIRARHFLLGNNIACQRQQRTADGKDGAEDDTSAGFSIAALMADWKEVPIETFYLAGNCIGPNCAALFACALANNEAANALWLKRNPIGSGLGARSLGNLLSINQHLRVLDLNNCGLFDDGVREFAVAACKDARRPNCLQYIYLDANGLTAQGAQYLAPYLEKNKHVLRGIYIGLNRLGSKGAVEVCRALAGSTSLQILNFDSNSIRNDGMVAMLEQYVGGWPQLQAFSVGYYKSYADLGESVNFIGADVYQVDADKRIAIEQTVEESRVVDRLCAFIEHAPALRFCSIKGNCFSHEAQVTLAASAWKRAQQQSSGGSVGSFHFDNKQLFQPLRATPPAPEMDRLAVQKIKHGDLVVNIDSIYRNNM